MESVDEAGAERENAEGRDMVGKVTVLKER